MADIGSAMRLTVLLALMVLTACSQGSVEISDARIRLLPGDRPSAGYMTVVNNSAAQVVVTGAESPAFGMIMLHRSVERDGQSTMEHVVDLPVAAGATARLEPGGYHLMLMHRKGSLAIGDAVPITIDFADGSRRQVSFTVKGATTQ